MHWIEKSSFLMYTRYLEQIKQLSMERRGVLFTALLEYAATGNIIEMDEVTAMAFSFIRAQMDRDNDTYQEKVEARRRAGQLGGLAKKANADSIKTYVAKDSNAKNDLANLHDEEYVNVNEEKNNILCEARALFERLWKLYPSKKGKGQVSDAQKKQLLAIGETALVKAIQRYSAELQKDADWRKPQNGSTFFTRGYIDYLDENFTPSKERSGSKTKSFHNCSTRNYDYNELERVLLTTKP